jgi:hypothetical protein
MRASSATARLITKGPVLTIDSRGVRPAGAGSWGAVALRRVDGRFEITPPRPSRYDRPWARNGARNPLPLTSGLEASSPRNSQPRDATPSLDDLELGD